MWVEILSATYRRNGGLWMTFHRHLSIQVLLDWFVPKSQAWNFKLKGLPGFPRWQFMEEQITYCVWTWSSRMETTRYNHFTENFEKCFEISFALQHHEHTCDKCHLRRERENSAFIYHSKQTSAKIQACVERSAYRIWFWEGVCMKVIKEVMVDSWSMATVVEI